MRIIRKTAAVVTALLLVVGCQGLPSDSERLTERTEPVEYNSVVFTDYNLQRSWSDGLLGEGGRYRLSVERHGQRRTETGTTEVFAVIRNHTDADYTLEARTHFVDRDGVPTDADAVWKRFTASANSLTAYREYSTSDQPLQYRVEVRELR
ncbi:hypothetical protein QWY84_06480 [Aquisalimonas lutea]|uniref:hypothetical protein n=1 Tax=Aquisalimonas lutea TaxID=1327750 RepID=UPI0025B546EC|nr:hypothetical protein [Aquisalimonas lutea]MDN3517247.1 hypothetical protein [Aquisalimonas lutea]